MIDFLDFPQFQMQVKSIEKITPNNKSRVKENCIVGINLNIIVDIIFLFISLQVSWKVFLRI